MAWIPVAMAAASAYQGRRGALAAQNARDTATRHATDEYTAAYEDARSKLQPYADLGTSSGGQLSALLGLNGNYDPSLITRLPGYQFRLNEGLQTLDRSAAARGILGTGGYGRALTRYGQDYATGELNNQFNRLSDLYKTGYAASGTIGGWRMNTGNNIASAYTGQGENRADTSLGLAANASNLYQNLGTAAMGAMSPSQNLSSFYLGSGNYATSPANYAGGYTYTDPNDYIQARRQGLVP